MPYETISLMLYVRISSFELRAVLQPLIPQSVQIFRIAPSQVQSPAFALVKLRVVGDYPAL